MSNTINGPDYLHQKHLRQNRVDYRDASATGMSTIKDDRVFMKEQSTLVDKSIDDGAKVADKYTSSSTRTFVQNIKNRITGFFTRNLPSKDMLNDVFHEDIPGSSKITNDFDLLQKAHLTASAIDSISNRKELHQKYAITNQLIFHNPHLNSGSCNPKYSTNSDIQRHNQLASFINKFDNELKVNHEYKFGYHKNKPYTYIDNPLLKVVDDVYHRQQKHQPMTVADFGVGAYIVNDQLNTGYNVDLQHQWNKQNSVALGDNYNVPISTYLGVYKINNQKRQQQEQSSHKLSKRSFSNNKITQHSQHNQYTHQVPNFLPSHTHSISKAQQLKIHNQHNSINR